MIEQYDDKYVLRIMAKYDTIRDLDLETCESFRQFYRDNSDALHAAIERTGPVGLMDALHLIAATADGADSARRAMSVISPPDSPEEEPLF